MIILSTSQAINEIQKKIDLINSKPLRSQNDFKNIELLNSQINELQNVYFYTN